MSMGMISEQPPVRGDDSSVEGNSVVNGDGKISHQDDELGEKLAKRETKAVAFLRLCLFVTLVSAAVVVSVLVYNYTHEQEKGEFKDSFEDSSQKLGKAFQLVLERQLGAIASFSVFVTSVAIEANATWPFFTMPHMEAHATHMLSLAGAERIVLNPIVEAKDRVEWESYLINHIADWAEESFAYHDPPPTTLNPQEGTNLTTSFAPPRFSALQYEGQPDFSRGFSAQIYSYVSTPSSNFTPLVSPGSGPFMPWWQVSPMIRDRGISFLTNYDLAKDPTFQGNLLDVVSRKKAALGFMTASQYNAQEPGPSSGFYYPVLDAIGGDSVVATLATLIYWENYFLNVLPQKVIGVVAVLRNSCGQVFTFQVDGETVRYQGEGDLHDESFDSYYEEFSLTALLNEGQGSYLGLPMDEGGCQYTLRVYPSQMMKAEYMSNRPAIYMTISILIFLLTSLAFVAFDRLVEYRQRLVMKEAQASGAIVASLFPAAYRDRLMQANNERECDPTPASTFIDADQSDDRDAGDSDQIIADLYKNCSVVFADIAGFTSWSSTRSPQEVFTLLQTLFGAFDRIASRRQVFKIETIGDCYMAVTGLPNPQENHAIIMVKFARDILEKFNVLVASLANQLGDETKQLALRVGVHSGEVTAGILRGDKSRFQLFGKSPAFTLEQSSSYSSIGDCVNTASRMESTGKKGRIQVSCSTADILKEAGKMHMITPREDLVEAKGKGLMQTYWVTLATGTAKSASDVSSRNLIAV